MTGRVRSLPAVIVVGLAVLTAAMVPPEAAAAPASPAPAATSAPVATIAAKKKCKAFPPSCLIRFNKKETKYIAGSSIGAIVALIAVITRNPVVVVGAAAAAPALSRLADDAIDAGHCVQVLFRVTARPKVGIYGSRSKGCK